MPDKNTTDIDLKRPFVINGVSYPANVRMHVRIADGSISDAGRREIIALLAGNNLPALPEDWDWSWMVQKRLPYAGTFPKRYSAFVFKTTGAKTSSEILQQLGNFYANHASKGSDFWFDFDRTINWKDGDFGDKDSCFWGGRSIARDMIRENGGAVRFFSSETGNGLARAWIAPGHPQENDALLFNGYGMQLRDIARIIATFLGLDYQSMPMVNNGNSAGDLWINGVRDPVRDRDGGYSGGFVVTDASRLETYAKNYGHLPSAFVKAYDLKWKRPLKRYYCTGCLRCVGNEESGPEAGAHVVNLRYYCAECYATAFFTCESCGRITSTEEQSPELMDGLRICNSCRRSNYSTCNGCGHEFRLEKVFFTGKHLFCYACYRRCTTPCLQCGHLNARGATYRCANCDNLISPGPHEYVPDQQALPLLPPEDIVNQILSNISA